MSSASTPGEGEGTVKQRTQDHSRRLVLNKVIMC